MKASLEGSKLARVEELRPKLAELVTVQVWREKEEEEDDRLGSG